jgi:hypothetical protein
VSSGIRKIIWQGLQQAAGKLVIRGWYIRHHIHELLQRRAINGMALSRGDKDFPVVGAECLQLVVDENELRYVGGEALCVRECNRTALDMA